MKLLRQKSFLFTLLGLLFLYNLLVLLKILGPDAFPARGTAAPGSYPEIQDLENRELSFKELSEYFTALAEHKGAEYAYDVLRVASIPPGTDMHLMGHVVGDILYKQDGAKGIQICTQDFRNACSHSIVVGLFFDKGDGALPEIADICRNAPGGSGAYTMCFHGLGHGILAYTGYDMAKAAELCAKTGTAPYGGREGIECVGGTVMEIIGGGFHDRALWEKQSKKYLSSADPLALCQADFIPDDARAQCYVYLTPHLFKTAGADLARPEPQHYEKAFTFCNAVPVSEAASRATCFGGFGKEFVVLAKNRDIRNVDKMTLEELQKVYDWCTLAPHEEGALACVNTAAASLYWGGENDWRAVIRFCGLVDRPTVRSSCFANIIGAVGHFIKDPAYREAFCKEIPREFEAECRRTLFGQSASPKGT